MRYITVFELILILVCLGGCNYYQEFDSIPDRTDFVVGQEYEVLQYVFMYTNPDSSILARMGDRGTPETIGEFRGRLDEGLLPHVDGLLAPGDRIRISRIARSKSVTLGEFVLVYAIVETGILEGNEVRINRIAKYEVGSLHWDPVFLRPINDT